MARYRPLGVLDPLLRPGFRASAGRAAAGLARALAGFHDPGTTTPPATPRPPGTPARPAETAAPRRDAP
jgi:hypothetical protein